MQISNDDQKKDTSVKSYDQISFFDNLQCKTNSFGAVLLWVFKFKKNVVPGLRSYGQKNLQNSKKSYFGAPCYRMLLNDLYYFKDANNT